MSSQFLRGAMALRVFACFGAAYFMSYALRSVVQLILVWDTAMLYSRLVRKSIIHLF